MAAMKSGDKRTERLLEKSKKLDVKSSNSFAGAKKTVPNEKTGMVTVTKEYKTKTAADKAGYRQLKKSEVAKAKATGDPYGRSVPEIRKQRNTESKMYSGPKKK